MFIVEQLLDQILRDEGVEGHALRGVKSAHRTPIHEAQVQRPAGPHGETETLQGDQLTKDSPELLDLLDLLDLL